MCCGERQHEKHHRVCRPAGGDGVPGLFAGLGREERAGGCQLRLLRAAGCSSPTATLRRIDCTGTIRTPPFHNVLHVQFPLRLNKPSAMLLLSRTEDVCTCTLSLIVDVFVIRFLSGAVNLREGPSLCFPRRIVSPTIIPLCYRQLWYRYRISPGLHAVEWKLSVHLVHRKRRSPLYTRIEDVV